MTFGLAIRWAVPWGCGTRVGATVYLWSCLFPGTLFTSAPASVVVLGMLTAAIEPFRRWVWQHPLLISLVAAALVYGATLVVHGVIFAPSGRSVFWDIASLPQPFLSSFLAVGVFALILKRAWTHHADQKEDPLT